MVVEAIEDLFIPVLVYNNIKGKDSELLAWFREPSWNNPVIRYLDSKGRDVIPRKDGVWDTAGTASRMVAALKATNVKPPKYLELIAADQSKTLKKATFAMHCYWEGEANLGKLDGVANTHSAWVGGKEVVEVTFDPAQIEFEKLITQAIKMKCATTVFAHDTQQLAIAKKNVGKDAQAITPKSNYRTAKLSDQKYYLRQTILRHLPLTTAQATKINAALFARKNVRELLSPRQLKMLEKIESRKSDSRLRSLVFPNDDSKLIAYTQKLEEFLSKK